jgi:hypothetical protein
MYLTFLGPRSASTLRSKHPRPKMQPERRRRCAPPWILDAAQGSSNMHRPQICASKLLTVTL